MNSRRGFFKQAAALVGAAVLVPITGMAANERRGGGNAAAPAAPAAGGGGADLNLPLVEPGKGMAASLNYHYKNTDVKDAALKIERQGTPFAGQHCGSCMLYTKVGNKSGGEVGKCQLFQGQLVKSTGWCASWNKKV
jgi:hypothetical protein